MFKVREIIRILESLGWYKARQNDTSHRQYKHPAIRRTVTVDGYVIARDSFEKLRKDLEKGVQFHVEGLWPEERKAWMNEAFSFEYRFEDIPSLLEGYHGVLNQSILARISGINESLMRQYVLGIKRPGAKAKQRILTGLKTYADELKAVSL